MQWITLPLAAMLLISMCVFMPELRQNAFILIAIPLMLVQTIRNYNNYKVILRMLQPADKGLKQYLDENLQALKREAIYDQQVVRVIFMVFIMAMEITLYLRLVPAYQPWGNVSIYIRAAVYVLLISVQPRISRYFFKFHFGKYLSRLDKLVKQAS